MATTAPAESQTYTLSEDVREVLYLAPRLAKKATKSGKNTRFDRYALKALMQVNRPFSRLDAILKALKVSATALKKSIDTHLGDAPATLHEGESLPGIETQLESLLAQTSPYTKPHNVVEMEHLLKALTYSSDPVVQAIFAQHNITEAAIDGVQTQAIGSVKRKTLFFLRETIEIVLVVMVSFIFVKEGLGELRLIPSESMLPLLQVEDRVLIEKVTRWPVPGIHREYQRGDVLVFYPPMTTLNDDPWSAFLRITGISGLMYQKEDNIDLAYIKRLIGVPGDTLEVVPFDGVYINGKKLDEPYIREVAQTCTQESPIQKCSAIKIPKGYYFMMGDNRGSSADSRFWGFEPQERVVGRAIMKVFPFNRIGMIPQPEYRSTETKQAPASP